MTCIRKSRLGAASVTWLMLAGFIVLLVGGVVGARAQSADEKKIDEIVRKAEASEPEDGFCAGTGWPPGDSRDGFTAFLKSAAVKSWKINSFKNGSCTLDRVTRVHQENGGKCVTYSGWTCAPGKTCGTYKTVDCLNRQGVFVTRRDG